MSATSTRASSAHDNRSPGFICTKGAAKHLSVHPDTLRRYRREGGGPPYTRVGRVVRYDIEALDAWMAERRVSSMAEEIASGGEA